ncbi:MAG: LolA family protein [Oceanococcus sp.]
MMRLASLLIWVLIAPLAQAESDALQAIRAQLQLPVLDTGSFVQKRELAMFPQALISQGQFAHVRDAGLLWQVESPMQSDLRILAGQAQERIASGPWSDPLLGAQGSQVAAQLLTSLLAADLDALQTHFDVTGEIQAELWKLQLQPKQAAIQSMLQSASVSGASQVEQLNIVFASGEQMRIALTHDKAPALTPAQEQALEITE